MKEMQFFVFRESGFQLWGKGENESFPSKEKDDLRFARKHTSEQPRCHSVWALGAKPPENHTASSSSSSPAERSSCSRFICSIFSRGISLRF